MLKMIIALVLMGISLFIIKVALDYCYRYYSIKIINLMWYYWRQIKGTLFGDIIFIAIGFSLFFIWYVILSYRDKNGLVEIIKETEIMANGDLDRVIKPKADGEIKELSENINKLSTALKNLTIEERRAQKTKSDLITNVSHDLRTPLTSILGYLEFIDSDKYKDELELRYYVNIAYEKSKSLNLLINDLFELTKLQNNSISINKSKINLVDLLGQIIAYFEYQFKTSKMKSRIKFSQEKLIINADGEELVRAFENLLSNAIKYGSDGYFVDIITKREEDRAVVQIINYGDPIPSIDLPHIFDRFYRVEKSRNSNIGGSGLGLAITKNIIELHSGIIFAYSDTEKTIFEIKLPIIE
jgi:signal transduction histidine kinase